MYILFGRFPKGRAIHSIFFLQFFKKKNSKKKDAVAIPNAGVFSKIVGL